VTETAASKPREFLSSPQPSQRKSGTDGDLSYSTAATFSVSTPAGLANALASG